jgi:hypothetical protein
MPPRGSRDDWSDGRIEEAFERLRCDLDAFKDQLRKLEGDPIAEKRAQRQTISASVVAFVIGGIIMVLINAGFGLVALH